MIDIHSHVLPYLDDGASDIEQAIAMLHNSKAQGITHLVATPHFNTEHYDVSIAAIEQAFQVLKKNASDVKVALAAEVRLSDELIPKIKNQQVPFIGSWQGKPALLLELSHRIYPQGADLFISWLIKQGIHPIIAHPERYQYFLTQPAKLQQLIKLGCSLQLTGDSLLGLRGQAIETFSKQLLQEVDDCFIASDAHNLNYRPFNSLALKAWLKLNYGESKALDWLVTKPATLTDILFQNPSRCYCG